MQITKTPMLLAISALILLAAPAVSPAGTRFEAGTIRFGAGLGLRGSSQGITFSIGAAGGVFVLKGLDVGVSTLFQAGGDSPTLFMTAADVRFIPLPDLTLTPYVKVSGGRLFVEGDDAWLATAGGGLLYLLGPWYGIDLEGAYRWLFYPGEEPIGDWYLTVGLVLLF